MGRIRPLALIVFLMLPVLTGCAKELLTRERYDTVMVGKSDKLDVKQTLGEKYVDRSDHWEYEDPQRSLTVYVYWNDDDRVAKKEWINAKTGEWSTEPEELQEGDPLYEETRARTIQP